MCFTALPSALSVMSRYSFCNPGRDREGGRGYTAGTGGLQWHTGWGPHPINHGHTYCTPTCATTADASLGVAG